MRREPVITASHTFLCKLFGFIIDLWLSNINLRVLSFEIVWVLNYFGAFGSITCFFIYTLSLLFQLWNLFLSLFIFGYNKYIVKPIRDFITQIISPYINFILSNVLVHYVANHALLFKSGMLETPWVLYTLQTHWTISCWKPWAP